MQLPWLRAEGSPVIEQCKKHLEDAGESYGEHMVFAMTVGLMAVGAGLACLVHALIPALCKHRCSETVRALYRLFENRGELDQARHQASGAMTFVGLTSLALLAVAPLVAAAPGEWWAWTAATLAFAVPAHAVPSAIPRAADDRLPTIDPTIGTVREYPAVRESLRTDPPAASF